MDRARALLRSSLALALASAFALAGCAGLGNPPAEAVTGPSHLVAIHNSGPYDSAITVDTRLPNGSHILDTFRVAAGRSADHRTTVPASSALSVHITYAWTQEGHAASGVLDVSYDTATCGGTYHVDVTIDTTPGNSWSRQTTACA